MNATRLAARGAEAALVLTLGLAGATAVIADVRTKIDVEGSAALSNNPLLIAGSDRSAGILEAGIRPSIELKDGTGLDLELSGLLAGRHYTRRYDDVWHGNAQLAANWRKNEWLSIAGLAAFNRQPLIDRLTSDIDAAVISRGVVEEKTGRLSVSWHPDARTLIQPEFSYQDAHYPGLTPLSDTSEARWGLRASRRTSAFTTLGARFSYARARVVGTPDSDIYAAYATFDQRLSAFWRLSIEAGAERVQSPVFKTTQASGRVELCREGEHLSACASGGVTSGVSSLGGVQRRIDLAATTNWRLSPRLTMNVEGQYQRATQQGSPLPHIDSAQARIRLERRLNSRLTASALAEYRQRDLLSGSTVSSTAVGIQLKYELMPL
ncbi:hypothetical protein [Sphingobium bisphenolivorans]|uniref:hypothetical protein n=1 Tax=Sphingobium bisphenolivorans TaxID=1335760 RepID=UPI0003A1C0DF|nr:hypothetical protein [Sphingobium bisphenolivorans]